MVHASKIRITLVTSLLFISGLGKAQAEDYVLDELYGSGVHAFFSRDYQMAIDLLTSASTEGSTDPRVYYFRGLANLEMGLEHKGEEDFRTGARYEVSKSGAYRIGHSLERVQGYNRLKVEQFRREASIQARRQRILRDRLRYQSPEGAGTHIIPPDPTKTDKSGDRATDPFTNEAADRPVGTGPAEETTGREPVADEPPAAEVDEAEDFGMEDEPFGDEPGFDEPEDVEDEPADDDPFGDAEGDEVDPFGGEGELDDDPFGGEGELDDDPFGES